MDRIVLVSVAVAAVMAAGGAFANESGGKSGGTTDTGFGLKSGVEVGLEVGLEGGVLLGKAGAFHKTSATTTTTNSSSDKDKDKDKDEKELLSSTGTGFDGGIFIGGVKYINRLAIGLRLGGGYSSGEIKNELSLPVNVNGTSVGEAKLRTKGETNGYFAFTPIIGYAVTDRVTVFVKGDFGAKRFKTSLEATGTATISTSTTSSPSTITGAVGTEDKGTKFCVGAGCGAKFDITKNVFLEGSYVYGFKVDITSVFNSVAEQYLKNNDVSVKYSDHKFVLGAGYKFSL
ncbi:MAG: outer membrane beta-barrel protein [Holosporales bacterium]|nr:outer membrane beta-barrel protein [Holosporales bacterium]